MNKQVDLIDREQAIEGVWEIELAGLDNKKVVDMLKDLPSVTPQEPKTGRWIDNKCTNCGYEVQPWNTTNYCPNCGAFCGGDNNG